ncbi:conserved hypothetical protein [Trichinella spiralis]|uniref:hypothetical protein n=1 Tax=Trichinella spiralis TaxID=6334 RepID=UPI0001EFE9D7|nr:conserved hypothetical protein [Trichinella spiralis]
MFEKTGRCTYTLAVFAANNDTGVFRVGWYNVLIVQFHLSNTSSSSPSLHLTRRRIMNMLDHFGQETATSTKDNRRSIIYHNKQAPSEGHPVDLVPVFRMSETRDAHRRPLGRLRGGGRLVGDQSVDRDGRARGR